MQQMSDEGLRQECGLSFTICNAIALYRQAIEQYKKRNLDLANDCEEGAGEYYAVI